MRSGAWWARRVAADWPAAEVETRSGWRLAWSEGVTRRANSAVRLEAVAPVEAVEEFYRGRGTAPCVQIWPGDEELDGRLARRGYGAQGATRALVRDLSEHPPAAHGAEVAVDSRPDAAWRALWEEAGQSADRMPALHRILDRAPTVGYALDSGGDARGCVVLDGVWAGVYAMVTRSGQRGRGLAGAVLEALLEWARAQGAERSYLLVEEDNAAALRVYERAGFVSECVYHYRVAPGAGRTQAGEAGSAAVSGGRSAEDRAPRAAE
ncbi:GNAT family N-acetyltransferase [Streptomonospora alba]|uniref:GNAT family N-acetyltransferase n=1 Tax=Streptomonospora alba TaxID=183763 RepID=UPI0006999BA7|nr:GNAT family N-acetyltransferase [Streptomonospora alba]